MSANHTGIKLWRAPSYHTARWRGASPPIIHPAAAALLLIIAGRRRQVTAAAAPECPLRGRAAADRGRVHAVH